MGLFIISFRGHRYIFTNHKILQSLTIVFNIANSAGPDEMSHFGAFHLGIRCLPKYPFRISRSYVKSALSHGHDVDSMLAGPILCSRSG